MKLTQLPVPIKMPAREAELDKVTHAKKPGEDVYKFGLAFIEWETIQPGVVAITHHHFVFSREDAQDIVTALTEMLKSDQAQKENRN